MCVATLPYSTVQKSWDTFCFQGVRLFCNLFLKWSWAIVLQAFCKNLKVFLGALAAFSFTFSSTLVLDHFWRNVFVLLSYFTLTYDSLKHINGTEVKGCVLCHRTENLEVNWFLNCIFISTVAKFTRLKIVILHKKCDSEININWKLGILQQGVQCALKHGANWATNSPTKWLNNLRLPSLL